MTDPATPAGDRTDYDEIAYPTQAHAATHPDRLATIATLMGLQPASLRDCRVLELGCGNAENLIAMAASLPDARFVGVDLAASPIVAGRQLATDLHLSNLTLLQQDLRVVPKRLGMFDYIIAHGVFSWVPPAVRNGMLALIARRLAPQGIAFVSYNVYPGCYMRRMAWEILKFHTGEIDDPRTRLAEAQALIKLMADPGNLEQPNNLGLRQEFRELSERPESVLFHDDLALVNDPVYFHEFAVHADAHGLKFLGEAEFHMMGDRDVAPAVRAVLAGMDRLSREQYLDFVRGRRFRQTLLCHAALEPEPAVEPQQLHGLWAVAPKLVGHNGVRFPAVAPEPPPDSTAEPLDPALQDANATLREITLAWPRPIAVADLAQRYRSTAQASSGKGAVPSRLAEILVAAYRAGAIELHAMAPAIAYPPGERPQATAIARAQIAYGNRVTNLWHEDIRLEDEVGRRILPLLDGTRDRAALLAALAPSFTAGEDASPGARLDRHLEQFARLGLLVDVTLA